MYRACALHVKAEVDDVAILHDVVLSLDADEAFFTRCRDAAVGYEVVEVHDLGADEAALEVGVNLARGLRRLGTLDDGPGTALVGAGREESLQAEQVEGGLDEAVEATLALAEVLEEGLGLLRVEFGDFGLHFRGDGDDLRALLGGEHLNLLHVGVLIPGRGDFVLGHVADVERRLQREQVHFLDHLELVVRELDLARRLRLVEAGLDAAQDFVLHARLFRAGFRDFRELHDALLDDFEVGEAELGLDDVDVAQRVDAALDVRDVRVVKAAHDMGHGVHLTDVLEELVAKALALGGALHEARDIHEAHRGRRRLLRVVHLMQHLQPGIRHGHNADVRLNRAEREVRRLGARLRNRIKKRALTHVGQANNTYF